jgi:hypothetical protein
MPQIVLAKLDRGNASIQIADATESPFFADEFHSLPKLFSDGVVYLRVVSMDS